jgi:hypothetical protein
VTKYKQLIHTLTIKLVGKNTTWQNRQIRNYILNKRQYCITKLIYVVQNRKDHISEDNGGGCWCSYFYYYYYYYYYCYNGIPFQGVATFNVLVKEINFFIGTLFYSTIHITLHLVCIFHTTGGSTTSTAVSTCPWVRIHVLLQCTAVNSSLLLTTLKQVTQKSSISSQTMSHPTNTTCITCRNYIKQPTKNNFCHQIK